MSHPVDIHVGKKLKELRQLRSLTQTDIAQGLGISFQQIQKYELGRNRISASRLYELAHLLDVETSYFFAGLNEDQADEPANGVTTEEANRIASAFSRIKDDRLRTQISTLITELSD